METPDFISAMLRPEAYPHPCGDVRLVETHISWVFLTGDFAYKVKKPVCFSFVDFSTASLRTHFCEEELRCNRAFAPELYVGLVTINRDPAGQYHVNGAGQEVETAVKMREFPAVQQLDNLLADGTLEPGAMYRFGHDLAHQHAKLPTMRYEHEVDEHVLQPIVENFAALRPLCPDGSNAQLLDALETESIDAYQDLRPRFVKRGQGGYTRECHGDLHLSNLVMLKNRVRAFDCLEFNPNLRWIDTASDSAFLLMDCAFRGRGDLGYAFLDGYLSVSADYDGAALAGFYQVYRSVVRAKVAGLQIDEHCDSEQHHAMQGRMTRHLEWAQRRLRQSPGVLLLMCGFSGSGKSWLARRLAPVLPAVRIRSDALRKRLAGLATDDRSNSPLDGGIYAPAGTEAVYAAMLDSARELLQSGEHVIVDATFLSRENRNAFQVMASRYASGCTVVHCAATQAILEQRITQRQRDSKDLSEAGIAVLQAQTGRFDAIDQDENAITVDTEQPICLDQLAAGLRGTRH